MGSAPPTHAFRVTADAVEPTRADSRCTLSYNLAVSEGISIVVDGVTKSYDDGLVTALDGVSFDVSAGERVALTGPTGCGKTTLLALLALLMAPDSGRISLDGEPIESVRSPEMWRAHNVGIVFQLHHLLPHLTVLENTLLSVAARGRDAGDGRDRATGLLARLGLEHRTHTRANKLSGGERQLAALARAMVNRPRLVIADEPTGSVDSATGQRILSELTLWSEETGGTLILATHDSSVAAWASRELRMLDGRIAGDDSS
jgi:ABC-type lipoprotein export system ATPase subunit